MLDIVFMHKLMFYDYLRNVRTEETAWDEDEMFLEHDYYNSIPGKEPPLGGIVDSRLRTPAALLGHIHSLPQSKAAQVLVLALQNQSLVPCSFIFALFSWLAEYNCKEKSKLFKAVDNHIQAIP